MTGFSMVVIIIIIKMIVFKLIYSIQIIFKWFIKRCALANY